MSDKIDKKVCILQINHKRVKTRKSKAEIWTNVHKKQISNKVSHNGSQYNLNGLGTLDV